MASTSLATVRTTKVLACVLHRAAQCLILQAEAAIGLGLEEVTDAFLVGILARNGRWLARRQHRDPSSSFLPLLCFHYRIAHHIAVVVGRCPEQGRIQLGVGFGCYQRMNDVFHV